MVGRYSGRIYQWDVANEIFNDEDGSLRAEENIWIRELGSGIITDAFRWRTRPTPKPSCSSKITRSRKSTLRVRLTMSCPDGL